MLLNIIYNYLIRCFYEYSTHYVTIRYINYNEDYKIQYTYGLLFFFKICYLISILKSCVRLLQYCTTSATTYSPGQLLQNERQNYVNK